MATGVYISQPPSKLTDLYHELNSLYFRTVAADNSVDFNTRNRFRLIIKEYGTQNKDGHFTMGFADGSGPSFTKLEMTDLTLETIANTLMFMKMIHFKTVKKITLSR